METKEFQEQNQTYLGIGSVSNQRQPGYFSKQARPTSNEETDHEIQEHSVVEHN